VSSSYVVLANSYARDVVAGKIPTAKWTILACKRALRDVQRKSFAYRFDEDAANRVCKFIERCRHIKGEWARRKERIKLEPWQCFVICQVFGWLRKSDGMRRFRTVYIEVPRKNAKSTLTSAVALYMLAADGEAGAECYSAAKGRKQAQIVFEDAQAMARADPEFLSMLGVKVGAHSIGFGDGNRDWRGAHTEVLIDLCG